VWTKVLTIYIDFSTIIFVYISFEKECVKINEDKQNKLIFHFRHLQSICPSFSIVWTILTNMGKLHWHRGTLSMFDDIWTGWQRKHEMKGNGKKKNKDRTLKGKDKHKFEQSKESTKQ